MKILSIETCSPTYINGYVDDGRGYRSFELRPSSPVLLGPSFSKKNFRNLAHFAGVIGKFDPHAFILAEPIEIDSLTFKTVRKTYLTDSRF